MMNALVKRSSFLLVSATLLFPATQGLAASSAASTNAVSPAYPGESSGQPVEAKLSKQQALSIATSRVSLPAGMELTNAAFRSGDSWQPYPEWSFYWTMKSKTSDGDDANASVTVNANSGEITQFSINDPNEKPASLSGQLNREEASKLADQYLAKMNPEKMKLVRLYERDMPKPKPALNANIYHNFHYARYVDGVLFPDNGVDITVSGTGKVISYSLQWNDALEFGSAKPKLSIDDVRELYQTKTKAALSYMLPWDQRDKDDLSPILVYRNPFDFYIDADSGDKLNRKLQTIPDKSEPEPVSASKLSPLHKGGALTQDAAVALAQKVLNLSDYKLTNAYYNEKNYRGNHSVWDLTLEKKDGSKEGTFVSVALDADTGDIYSMYKDVGPQKAEKSSSSLSDEQLKSKAFSAFRSFTPSYASDFAYIKSEEGKGNKPYQDSDGESTERSFQFQRYIQGIQAATGSMNVLLDKATGEVLRYNVDVGTETYPSRIPKHKPADEAAEAWLKEADIELIYAQQIDANKILSSKKRGSSTSSGKQTAKLVYRVSLPPTDESFVYKADSGEWINESTGKPYQLHREKPVDIDGHVAEKELMLMYEYEAISLIDGKIMPERPITRGEMIDMLIISINQGPIYRGMYAGRKASFADVANSSAYFASVERAVDLGLLDKGQKTLQPDETITREELASMLVRALGYSKLAEHTEMFQSPLTDIAASKQRGAITIVSSLGIMPAEGNKFTPAGKVSRADAATAFSRFLEKRVALEENKRFAR